MSQIPELSVVLPVFNEESNLPELYSRLRAVLDEMDVSYELLFVDDHSADGSLGYLRGLLAEGEPVRLLAFSRNFGHQVALTAGLDHARGDAVVFMDSDLQDPPELLPTMYARYLEGFPVVYARRRARPGESVFKRLTAYLFYRLLRSSTHLDIPADTGDFRLLSRKAADAMRQLQEKRRFLRGLVVWTGFRRSEVLYDRPARARGESNYSLTQMMRLGLTAIFSFSSLPIALIGLIGLVLLLVAPGVGWLSGSWLAAGLFFMGAVQMISMWVLGQYVLMVTDEARGRPLYVIAESSPVPVATGRSAASSLAASGELR